MKIKAKQDFLFIDAELRKCTQDLNKSWMWWVLYLHFMYSSNYEAAFHLKIMKHTSEVITVTHLAHICLLKIHTEIIFAGRSPYFMYN